MTDADFSADLDLDPDTGPILDPVEAGSDRLPSPLDDLVRDLTAKVEDVDRPIKLRVEGRPGYVALYQRNFDARLIQKWERASTTKRKGQDVIDAVRYNGLILANTNIGIERHGEPVINPDTDEPLTFRDRWFLSLYDAPSVIEAIRRFYGTDALFMAAGSGVIAASGYGEEAEEVEDDEDPT